MFRRKKEYGRYAKKDGVYVGRMAANGDGHLVAEEGPRKGEFVAWDEDVQGFVFVKKGTQTHNVRWHQQFAHVEPGEEV
jgi:hypothetical protein